MADRTPRTTETRDAEVRPKAWAPRSTLPTPEPRDGLKFRWIRTATLGKNDNPNVSARFREGYVPVKAADYPEMQLLSDVDSRFRDNIEVGGLLLCATAAETANQRIAYQLNAAQTQMDAVDRSYLRESDPRMPVLPIERSSRTSFGK